MDHARRRGKAECSWAARDGHAVCLVLRVRAPMAGANWSRMSLDVSKATKIFDDEQRRERAERKRPNVLVCGFTGTGKTTLIKCLCGAGIVPDEAVGHGAPKTQGFDVYEGKSIRFFDSRGLEPGESEALFIEQARKFVRARQDAVNLDEHVHLVWYVVQGPGARITSCDLRLMKEIFPRSGLIVVISKADITKPTQLDAMRKVLLDAGIPSERIVACSEGDQDSLRALERVSYETLPEAYRSAFTAAQQVNLERKQVESSRIVHAASAAAAAAAAVPLPFSDAALITPFQMAMIFKLATIYGEPDATLRAALLPILAEMVGVQTTAGLAKFLPGLGSVLAAVVAGALTEAIGALVNASLVARCRARLAGLPVPPFAFDLMDFYAAFERAKKKAA